jgi:hypothetical protein
MIWRQCDIILKAKPLAAKVRKQLKKGRATKKTLSRRDAAAAALADARYRKRVVASAKVYRRKGPPAPQEDENE